MAFLEKSILLPSNNNSKTHEVMVLAAEVIIMVHMGLKKMFNFRSIIACVVPRSKTTKIVFLQCCAAKGVEQ